MYYLVCEMINNSLITSFFSSPDHNVSSIQLSLVNTSPILLSPDSLDDLETLSLQDNLCYENVTNTSQIHNSDPNETSILSAGNGSVVIVEGDFIANNEEDLPMDSQAKGKKQSTLSNLFLHPPTSPEVANEHAPERRERRKAAVKATQQMTQMLSTTRSREDNVVTDMKQRNVVASIFLSAAEKRFERVDCFFPFACESIGRSSSLFAIKSPSTITTDPFPADSMLVSLGSELWICEVLVTFS